MADLDEVVQKILLDGDEEVVRKLREIGESGLEAFEKLNQAAEHGSGGLALLTNSLGQIASALGLAAGAVVGFVDTQDEAIQKTNFLAEALGTTTAQLVGVEAAFAQAGVSTKTFEQFAQRLTTTIAREWPAIAANIRTSSEVQASAQERVVASTLRVREAQDALSVVAARTASQIANANLAAEAAYIKLQFAAQAALATIAHDINSVTSANLGLESAQQRLDELQGKPVSDADKQSLQIKQAQLAVDQARQQVNDAQNKQFQDQAEAQNKQAKAEQEAQDAALKRETALIEANTARQKAELAVKEAITAKAEAQERADQAALKDIPSIVGALKSIQTGASAASQAVDITQVSIQDLIKGIIALAANGNALPPKGFDVMVELSKLLSSEQGKLIDSSQKLAIVQQLLSRGFGQQGVAASELLGALERGPEFFKKFTDQAAASNSTTKASAEAVKEFRDVMAALGFQVELVNRELSSGASQILADGLNAIKSSLSDANGFLHLFVDGIKAIGAVIGNVIEGFQELFAAIDKAFNLQKGTALEIIIGALTLAAVAFGSAWLAIPAAIAAVGVAIGYLGDHIKEIKKFIEDNAVAFGLVASSVAILVLALAPIPVVIGLIIAAVGLVAANWDKVKEAISGAIDAIKQGFVDGVKDAGTAVFNFFDSILTRIKAIKDAFLGIFSGGTPGAPSAGGSQSGQEASIQGFSTGGHVRGPGTATSDSIPARLSAGEYVNRTAAVQKYGVDFFHAINNLSLPGFASGGLVGGPSRVGPGSHATQATSTVNLSIDGRSFNGLRGPKSTVDDLTSFAISRQAASAGNRPSWNS